MHIISFPSHDPSPDLNDDLACASSVPPACAAAWSPACWRAPGGMTCAASPRAASPTCAPTGIAFAARDAPATAERGVAA
jgi:hypothetical protein